MAKNKGGRPSVFTEEVIQKLEQAFALGCTDTEACLYADIAISSLYHHQKGDQAFLDRKNLLKESPVLLARQEVIKGMKDNPELSLKYLERKKKGEFSLKIEQKIDGEIKVNIVDDLLQEIDGGTKDLI